MRPLFSCVALVIGKKSLSFHIILLCTLHTMYCRAGGASNAIANLSITPSALGCSRGEGRPWALQCTRGGSKSPAALVLIFPFCPFIPAAAALHICVYVRVYVILVVAKMPWWLFLVYHQVTPSPRPQLKTLDRFHFHPSSTVKCTMHMLH